METDKPKATQTPSPLAIQSFTECEAMAKYAMASGLKISGSLLQRLKTLEVSVNNSDSDSDGMMMRRLGDCHNQLSQLVAPATPRAILLLEGGARPKGSLSFLGPLPLTRHMMIAALLSLVTLICLTLFPEVNGSHINSDILLGSGMPLLLNELFLLSAAALGASFSALFIANRYIQEGTFDPKYNISYWIRFVLGLIAGFILATLIDINALTAAGANTANATTPFARPLLAMLGGFSASVVYRILNRLAESVESLFRGDLRDQVKAKTDAERSQLMSKSEQEKSRLAYRLMAVQKKVSSEGTPADIQKELDSIMRELIGDDTFGGTEAVKAPATATQ